MALTYKTRRRLALLILVVGLPLYIVAAVAIMASLAERPPLWVEFAIYVGLGILWALPLKAVFRGIGQADPETQGRDRG